MNPMGEPLRDARSGAWPSSRTRLRARSRSICSGLGALALAACLGGSPPARPVLDPDQVQRGAYLFLNPGISSDGQRSCATCHPGGGSDGQVYRDGVAVEPGSEDGRRTLQLRGLWQTAPYFWDGSAKTVREAVERMLRVELAGARLAPHDLDALAAYVQSISPFDNGKVEADGTPIEPVILSALRGAGVFQKAKCGVCHVPPAFTHRLRFDVGTGGKWSVPTLRNVSNQPRLGHDGRWPDLESAVDAILRYREVELTPQERQQLISYLHLL